MNRLRRKKAEGSMSFVIPTAEPFFFPGGETACLVVHGFTGTPKEMRWMGQYLAGKGYTVLGIRLAGHATRKEDMQRTHWEDWLASVEDGIHFLRGYPHLYVMGLSMGGSLSLMAGARYPIDGVVSLSAPYDLPDDARKAFLPVLRHLPIHIKKGKPDWHNPDAAKDHISYDDYPITAVAELNELLAALRDDLSQVKVPVQMIHSRNDHGVLPINADLIYEHLGTADKNLMWVEDSGHVITREPEREKAFQTAVNFMERINHSA
jgi:carboxylesterase